MQGVALATALRGKTAAQFIQGMRKKINPNENYSTNKKYFSCGQMEHFCWQCPATQRQQAMPIQTKTNPPKTPCPRCLKRHHWVKGCRSELRKDETMLTPQVQTSNFPQFQGNRQQGQSRPQTIGQSVKSLYSLCSLSELLKTAPGSSGLDLSSTMATILTPDMLVTLIPMGVADPLPEGIVLLVLGHSLLSFQGISVVSGVVDYDYTEKINVLVSPLCKLIKIKE